MLFRIPLPNQAKCEEQGKTKTCTKCGKTKPLTEFHKRMNRKCGVQSRCKVCKKACNAKYRSENPEKEKARQAKYYAENREKRRAYDAKRRIEHPEKRRAARAKWVKANPDKVRAKNQRRRAKKRNAPGTFTAEDWKAKLAYYGYKCRYCGIHKSETKEGWLEADHAIPLSQGGSNFISNIVPACRSCNASKNARTFKEFLNGK